MQEYDKYQPIGAPPVHVSKQTPKWYLVDQINNRVVGSVGRSLVGKFDHQAGAEQ